MKRFLAAAFCLLLMAPAAAAAAGAPKQPPPEVLGLRLDMAQADAHERLKKMGTLEKKARKRQEVWAISDPRVSHIIVAFSAENRVRYVTAIARADAPRIRYDELGRLKNAKTVSVQGNYKYTWEVAGRRGQQAYVFIALGRDPQFLDSYSVKKVGDEEID